MKQAYRWIVEIIGPEGVIVTLCGNSADAITREVKQRIGWPDDKRFDWKEARDKFGGFNYNEYKEELPEKGITVLLHHKEIDIP